MKVTSERVGLFTNSSPMTTLDCAGGSLGGMGFRAWIFSAIWFSAPAAAAPHQGFGVQGLRLKPGFRALEPPVFRALRI